MIVTGGRIELAGVPHGLIALARVETTRSGGESRERRDRRGRLRLRHGVVLVAGDPNGQPRSPVDATDVERLIRRIAALEEVSPLVVEGLVLQAATRSRSTVLDRLGERGDHVAWRLARAGVVELISDVEDTAVTVWRRWLRTPAAEEAAVHRDDARDADSHELERRLSTLAVAATKRGWTTTAEWLIGSDPQGPRPVSTTLDVLQRALERLPLDGVPLSVFARDVTDDTHGLDRGRAAGATLVHLAARVGADLAGEGPKDPLIDATSWRRAWESVGVVADALSCAVMTWHLPVPSHAHQPAARLAAVAEASGEPVWLTLRSLVPPGPLVRAPLAGEAPLIFVCENAAVIESACSADISAPLVCHAGVPNAAVVRALDRLVEAGWELAVGADLEPRPLRSVANLLDRYPNAARPWRLSASDVARATRSGAPFRSEDVPDTRWDPLLANLLRADPRRCTEEDRLDVLLADLKARDPHARAHGG